MEQKKILQDVLETVQFIKENGATKDDLADLQSEMNAMEKRLESSILEHVDGFIRLHEKLDTELTALRSKVGRMEEFIKGLAKHVQFEPQVEL